MGCYPSGLIIAPAVHWRQWDVLDDSLANLIVERATPLSLPEPWKMHAYRWQHPGRAAADCSSLRHLVSAGRYRQSAASRIAWTALGEERERTPSERKSVVEGKSVS